MKMVYKDKNPQVDKNMSDSNVGARKEERKEKIIYLYKMKLLMR